MNINSSSITVKEWKPNRVKQLFAFGLCLLSSNLLVTQAKVIDPTPENGFKKISYGLVVTKTPVKAKPGKKNRWTPKHSRTAVWKSGKYWKRVSDFVAYGPELTPDIKTAEGAYSLAFGGDLNIKLYSKEDGVWELDSEIKANVQTEHATWKIDTDTGMMEISPFPGRDNGKDGGKVKVSDNGHVEFKGTVAVHKEGSDHYVFEWEFLVRKTTKTFDKNEKLVERKISDFKVSDWHSTSTGGRRRYDKNGNVLSSSHYYIREKEPTPQKEWIIKYDQDGKIVPSKS